MQPDSIFKQYYKEEPFVDRYLTDKDRAVTIIIPTVHTNELWKANLLSIYREVPVFELLIGDGGCIDDSMDVASAFPRVSVKDHRPYKTLGFSIRKLIEEVKTEWFIYLHSDVYLPPGWFDKMYPNKDAYDWFGCRMRHTVMIEYDNDYGPRPYAGSQMGRTLSFAKGLDKIDDDFVYRQEDFVFSQVVAMNDGKEGKVDDVFHYHQTIKKPSPVWNPGNVSITISSGLVNEKEELRSRIMQAKGGIKYLQPEKAWVVKDTLHGIDRLIELGHMTREEMTGWIKETNAAWLPVVEEHWKDGRTFKHRIAYWINRVLQIFGSTFYVVYEVPEKKSEQK